MPESKGFYTTGPIGVIMLKTSSAMLIGTIALSLYNVVDTYFVGKLGTGPLAAMGFTLPVVMLCGCIFRGIFAGIMTISGQAIGAQDKQKAQETVRSGFYLAVLLSFLLAVIGKCYSHLVFHKLGASGETLEMVCGYMDIWFLGCVTGMVGVLGGDILIVVGDTKMASLAILSGTMTNVVLDYGLIFGNLGLPKMGIRGAALATIISQALCAILPWVLISNKYGLMRWRPLPPAATLRYWKQEIVFGVPVMLGSIILPVGQTVVTRIAAHFGDVAVAAMGAVNRLETLAFMIPMSVGFGLTAMTAQNYGAKAYDRLKQIYKTANLFAGLYLLLIAVVITLIADPLAHQFSNDPAVCDLMRKGLYIISWGFGLLEIHRYSGFFLTGCGKPLGGALLNIFRIVVLTIPLAFLALWLESVLWLFWGRLISDVLAGSVGLIASGVMIWRLAKNKETQA
jgi:putative efflux protein, MATE family